MFRVDIRFLCDWFKFYLGSDCIVFQAQTRTENVFAWFCTKEWSRRSGIGGMAQLYHKSREVEKNTRKSREGEKQGNKIKNLYIT